MKFSESEKNEDSPVVYNPCDLRHHVPGTRWFRVGRQKGCQVVLAAEGKKVSGAL